MENPFRSKGDVDARFFCDREEVAAELGRTLKGMHPCLLSSHRRFGKTWLARLVLKRLAQEGMLTAYLDLGYVHSTLQWIEWYASAVLSAVSASPQELYQLFNKHLPSLGIESVNAIPEGYRIRLRGHFTEAGLAEVAGPVFDLPEKIASEARRRFVVVLDEFPEIVLFGGKTELDRWKDILGRAKHSTYCFASARPRLLAHIFEDPGAPLSRTVKSFHLGKIPEERWTRFIQERFRRTSYRIEAATASELLKATRSYSYYTQMACRHLWNHHKDTRRVEIKDALNLEGWILEHEDHYFEQIWRSLTKPRQSFIAALAREPSRQVYSADYRLTHRLPPASTLQAALKHLEEEGLVERADGTLEVVDPFFRLWLRRQVA